MAFRLDDYIDADVSYLAGLIVARGTLDASNQRRLIIQFPHTNLDATGIKSSFNQQKSIRLGLDDIRERLAELLDTDIKIVRNKGNVELVVTFIRNSMIWRNILLLTGGSTSFPHFHVPAVFFDPVLPIEYKTEFIKGYGDTLGNIRKSNVYADGRHRVRLDVLNYPTNWEVAVQLCRLLQEEIELPVQLITWGHPNMNREFREHQINILAEAYLRIGFTFEHIQVILKEFAEENLKRVPYIEPKPCPGKRKVLKKKPKDSEERNKEKLDPRLVGKHCDAYWQLCKLLGCKRLPPDNGQGEIDFIDES